MDLLLLKKFYVVAREGNITSAARILNTSQPALSRAITLLEHQLKAKLFIRSKTGVKMTPQGERVYVHADTHIPEHDLFFKRFCANDDEIAGELNIVAYPYIGTDWFVDIIPNQNEN